MSGGGSNLSGASFRRVLGHHPTGVSIVTGVEPGGRAVGLAVGSFTSVSLDPPLVAFFPDRGSKSWPAIARAGHFCVNVLSSAQTDICHRFAGKSLEKFEGLTHSLSPLGSPILDGVVAWIDCALHDVHEAGDHFIVVGRVEGLDILTGEPPLVYWKGLFGGFAPMAGDDRR